MIIESLVTHIVAYFYFMHQPTKLSKTQSEMNQTPYSWGIFFTSLILFGLVNSDYYLSWLTISIGLVSGQAVFIRYVEPTLRLFLENTIKENDTHVLQSFYHKYEDIIAFSLQQVLIFIWIVVLNQLFFHLAHPLTKLFFIIISLGYLSLSNRKSIIWGDGYNKRVFQTLTSFIVLVALVLFLSQFVIQLIDSVSYSGLEVFSFHNNQPSYGLFIRFILVFLILMRPANLLIRSLSVQYDPKKTISKEKKQHAEVSQYTKKLKLHASNIPDESGFKGAGGMIGNLERFLIFLSFLNGSLLSVVAILSIKAFARYKLIADDPYFSEYFVIGTMLSVLITFGSYILLVFLLTI